MNPLVRRLVSRGTAGGHLLLLHFTGRRTGRPFDVPAGYHVIERVPTVLTNSAWRHNFAGGRDIEVTFRGIRRPARATLVEDVDAVTDAYVGLFERLGWQAAQRRLGVKVNVGREPTRTEIAEATRDSGLSLVLLEGLVGDEHLRHGSGQHVPQPAVGRD